LLPGKYRLMVRAADYEQSDEQHFEASLEIQICLPPVSIADQTIKGIRNGYLYVA
jgi:hypothetical protein